MRVRISYSAGFAALEQKTAEIKKLGKHSDVFSVGALLFYLLFGHVPNAFDCQSDAVYDFESGIYQPSQYQDSLFRDLTDFFHHSIASYYADRYSDLLPAKSVPPALLVVCHSPSGANCDSA